MLALPVLALVTLVGFSTSGSSVAQVPEMPAQSGRLETSAQLAPYSSDPGHAWNRAYRALFGRTAADGKDTAREVLDPLIWPSSTYIFEPERLARAVAALDEIKSNVAQAQLASPLKRALFQRDLWAIFDKLRELRLSVDAHPTEESARELHAPRTKAVAEHSALDAPISSGLWPASLESLKLRLARAMQAVALEPGEIATLPDNYALTIASHAYPVAFDPHRPERAFLPPDLFDPNGAWVLVSNADQPAAGLIAPVHTSLVAGRSSFAVYVHVGEERAATIAYLRALREFPRPLVEAEKAASAALDEHPGSVEDQGTSLRFNPALPAPPVGTSFALVRRMLLFDRAGELHATSIVESVELRTVLAIGEPVEGGGCDGVSWKPFQAMHAFELRREPLFAGEGGGLVAIDVSEKRFEAFFPSIPQNDPITEHRDWTLIHLDTCFSCHAQPGIFSMNSYTGFAFGPGTALSQPMQAPPHKLVEGVLADLQRQTESFKRGRDDWQSLRSWTAASCAEPH